uniref:Prepilin-type N-terminal cleavage/methylation domain-containing protein n=1 Tax=Desulfatirhabdium butyrativorans TaxID=340467 RepID=A0A7C4MQG2_9BACT
MKGSQSCWKVIVAADQRRQRPKIENAIARRRREGGFTLIEVLMAAVILAVGLLGLAAMQTAAIKANYQAKKHTLAVALAETQLEAYRNMAYDSIPSGTITDTDVTSGDVGKFTRVVTIENDVPVAGVKTITVSVFWNDGKLRKATLKTIIGALTPN